MTYRTIYVYEYFLKIIMQYERVRVCSRNLLHKGMVWSKFVPLEQDASVQDILNLFAVFLLEGRAPPHAVLRQCFDVLTNSQEDCMFVFMRRGQETAAGILHSHKPLLAEREKELLKQLGNEQPWNVPLWTWTENHHDLMNSMETQCRQRSIQGPCMGIWCYR